MERRHAVAPDELDSRLAYRCGFGVTAEGNCAKLMSPDRGKIGALGLGRERRSRGSLGRRFVSVRAHGKFRSSELSRPLL